MTDQQLADVFRYQWSRPGGMHWAFNTLQDCVTCWQKWGIDGMPHPTPGAIALLAPDIAKNEAWHASLTL